MYKVIATFKRNPQLTAEECDNYYRSFHTTLGRRLCESIPGFRKYVQNRMISTIVTDFNNADQAHPGEGDFDWAIEFHFDRAEDLAKAFASPEMKACFADHINFMDINIPGNIKTYEVQEFMALERDPYTGQLCYPATLADESPYKERIQRALAETKAGKP